jgi:hypothetical protein
LISHKRRRHDGNHNRIHTAVNASKYEILALIKTLHQAHYDKDANAIAAAYTADAEIYCLVPRLFIGEYKPPQIDHDLPTKCTTKLQ